MLLHNLLTFFYGIVTKPIAIGLGLEEENEPTSSSMNMFKILVKRLTNPFSHNR